MALNPKLLAINKSDWFSYGFLFTDFNDLKCTPLERKILDIRLKNEQNCSLVCKGEWLCNSTKFVIACFCSFFGLGSAQNTIAVYYLLRNKPVETEKRVSNVMDA